MTVAELLSYLQNKTGRTDKNTDLLAGINWVKNELCNLRLSALLKKGSVMSYAAGEYHKALPDDFGVIDKVMCVLSSGGNYYELDEGDRDTLFFDDTEGTYPARYCIIGTDLYIGCPRPGSDINIYPTYYRKPQDYTAASTDTPILSDIFGIEVYVFGAERYLWNCLNVPELEAQAEVRFQNELGKLKTRDANRRTDKVRPSGVF